MNIKLQFIFALILFSGISYAKVSVYEKIPMKLPVAYYIENQLDWKGNPGENNDYPKGKYTGCTVMVFT